VVVLFVVAEVLAAKALSEYCRWTVEPNTKSCRQLSSSSIPISSLRACRCRSFITMMWSRHSAGRGIGAQGDLELVAENEIFKREVATRSEAGKKTAEQEGKEWKHPAG